MFELHIGNTPCHLTPTDYRLLAEKTQGYSGSDIQVVVRDALMQPVRKVQTATHFKRVQAPSRADSTLIKDYWTPCSPGEPGAVEMSWNDIEGDDLLEPSLTVNDFLRAITVSRPTVNQADLAQQVKFTQDFGQEG
jgi:vacuolar protein-sorting-associated protein 4